MIADYPALSINQTTMILPKVGSSVEYVNALGVSIPAKVTTIASVFSSETEFRLEVSFERLGETWILPDVPYSEEHLFYTWHWPKE